jgi:hypothetical protein
MTSTISARSRREGGSSAHRRLRSPGSLPAGPPVGGPTCRWKGSSVVPVGDRGEVREKQAGRGLAWGWGPGVRLCDERDIYCRGSGAVRPTSASQPFPGCPVGLSSCFFVIGSLVSYSCTRQATVWLAWHRIQFLSFFFFIFHCEQKDEVYCDFF